MGNKMKKFLMFLLLVGLISCNKSSNQFDDKILYEAIKNNQLDVIKNKINKGLSVNFQDKAGNTLLHYACLDNKIDIAKFLVENGANIEAKENDGFRPIHVNHSPEFVYFFLSKGVNINSQTNEGDTILHMLAIQEIKSEKEYEERINFLKDLIENGANPNVENNTGEKPFHTAYLYGNYRISKFLQPYTKSLSKSAIESLEKALKEKKEKI